MSRHFIDADDAESPALTGVGYYFGDTIKAPLPRLICDAGIACSMGEARRLIEQGGISVDGVVVTDICAEVAVRCTLSVNSRRGRAMQALQEQTGASWRECGRALSESGGDVERAAEWLRRDVRQ